MAYSSKWVDKELSPKGMRIGFLSKKGFVAEYWFDFDEWNLTVLKTVYEDYKTLFNRTANDSEPEYWTELPDFNINAK